MKRVFCFLVLFMIQLSFQAQTSETILDDNLLDVVNKSTFDNDLKSASWLGKRFKIGMGAYFPLNNTQVRVGNNKGNIGTEIDFEDDLGFTNYSSSFIADFVWHASRRSRFALEYFYLVRNTTKNLDKEIEFGDNIYPVNARVTAFFDTQIFRFSYGYSVFSKPKFEAGFLIGAHVLLPNVGIRLESNFAGGEIKDDFGFAAPLPDIGIWGDFSIVKKMSLYLNANYFYIKVGDYKGSIISYGASLSYNMYKNFDVILGYTGLNFELDVEKERLNGFLKWGYNGPTLKVAYSFGKPVKF